MDKKDMLIITCSVIAAASGVISLALEHKTTMNDHERIQQLEDTVKWIIKSDIDLQKESDQSKN